jgi:hypothetical protein
MMHYIVESNREQYYMEHSAAQQKAQLELQLERNNNMSSKSTILSDGTYKLERATGVIILTEDDVEVLVREHMMNKIRSQVENHLKAVIADKLQQAFNKE